MVAGFRQNGDVFAAGFYLPKRREERVRLPAAVVQKFVHDIAVQVACADALPAVAERMIVKENGKLRAAVELRKHVAAFFGRGAQVQALVCLAGIHANSCKVLRFRYGAAVNEAIRTRDGRERILLVDEHTAAHVQPVLADSAEHVKSAVDSVDDFSAALRRLVDRQLAVLFRKARIA